MRVQSPSPIEARVIELTEQKQEVIATLSPEALKWKTARDTYTTEVSLFERIKKRSLRNDFDPKTGLNALGLTQEEVTTWDIWVDNNKAQHSNYLERCYLKAYKTHIGEIETRFIELEKAKRLFRDDCIMRSCQLEGELRTLVSKNPRAELEQRKANIIDKQQRLSTVSESRYLAHEAQSTLEQALNHIEAAFKLLTLQERIIAANRWDPGFEEDLQHYELYGAPNSLVQQSLHENIRTMLAQKKEQQRIFEQNVQEAHAYAHKKLEVLRQLSGTWRVAADPQIVSMIENFRIQLNQCIHKSQVDPIVEYQRIELNKEMPAARLRLLA